jgi:beta-galactosidase
LLDFFARLAGEAGLNLRQLPRGVRLRRRGDLVFAFNFASQVAEIPVPTKANFLVGSKEIKPGEVAIWRE